MAAPENSFPDGWHTDGVLGTDIVIDDTESLDGNTSFLFKSGGAETNLYSDWYARGSGDTTVGEPLPALLSAYMIMKSDNTIDNANYYIEYTSDFSTVTSSLIFSATNSTTANFENFGVTQFWLSSLSSYVRVRVNVPARTSNIWIDRIVLNNAAAGRNLYGINGGTFSGSWATVTDLSTSGIGNAYGGSLTTHTGGVITIGIPGLWGFSGSVEIADSGLEEGDMFGVRLKLTGFGSPFSPTSPIYVYGSVLTLHAAHDASTNSLGLTVSVDYIPLDVGETVELQVIQHTNTGTLKDFATARLTAVLASGEGL